MLEIQKRVLELKINGHLYKLKFPTIYQLKKLNELSKDVKDDKSAEIDLIVEMLADLGLPKEVSYDLEPEAFQKIIETLSGQQKKS